MQAILSLFYKKVFEILDLELNKLILIRSFPLISGYFSICSFSKLSLYKQIILNYIVYHMYYLYCYVLEF